ncbi:DNA/RNA non-specific endonuclease [Acidovorax sp. SRB_24]|uniref:DNA/RNA non-specific endonuclease n=1 Tax=Acidovorax sp. SRB_24 TaxID=1962700 RepID=UPI00145E1CDB|nr:DNA/RNA non-specific endonuclease [Acidovorax sp. SRB_24]
MTKKKKPRKSTTRRSRASGIASTIRRTVLWLGAAGVVAFQASSCGFLPTPQSLPSFPALERPVAAAATSFKGCPQFFAGGIAPATPSAPKLRELCYDAFAVLHSGNTRTPVFVAQRLNRASIEAARDEQRTDKFFADARLPRAERAELSDYKGSGWSRGHMAPAGDMPTPAAMAQSFSLANMVPQNPRQNSGPWAKIEADTRHYVMRAKGDVFVITGPVFAPGGSAIGSNQVAVPTHLFKLVYDAETKRAWAHWQPNADDARAGRPISYGELEQRVGMELLPGVEVR